MNSNFTTGIGLIVPRVLVKKVKDSLEASGQLDKGSKIRPVLENEYAIYSNGKEEIASDGKFYIPTTVPSVAGWEGKEWTSINPDLLSVFNFNGLRGLENEIGIATDSSRFPDLEPGRIKPRLARARNSQNLLARTIDTWLASLPQDLSDGSKLERQSTSDNDDHLSSNPSYTLYPPLLLLLPPMAIPTPVPTATNSPSTTPHLPSLYHLLCQTFAVTHIALNAPIPASFPTTPATTTTTTLTPPPPSHPHPNILRSPTNLTPLHGDFGPDLPPTHPPTPSDFASAFWCHARQNGILQTWAPRYTMFSRGNISEKARVLRMASLTEAGLGRGAEATSAVDLYAGVGYFAFCYARARVGRVLCWEINPWSVEGLRRGAEGNGWGVLLVGGGDMDGDGDGDALRRCAEGPERLLVFRESNAHAAERVAVLRDAIPPVRHVNCGFLPSSKGSWEVAVRVLDPAQGGWIHAHENVARQDVEARRWEIVRIFTDLVAMLHGPEPEQHRRVSCEHVERVKSYAPGVIHCVFDVAITPV